MADVSNGWPERDHGPGGGEGQILEGGVRLRTALVYQSYLYISDVCLSAPS